MKCSNFFIFLILSGVLFSCPVFSEETDLDLSVIFNIENELLSSYSDIARHQFENREEGPLTAEEAEHLRFIQMVDEYDSPDECHDRLDEDLVEIQDCWFVEYLAILDPPGIVLFDFDRTLSFEENPEALLRWSLRFYKHYLRGNHDLSFQEKLRLINQFAFVLDNPDLRKEIKRSLPFRSLDDFIRAWNELKEERHLPENPRKLDILPEMLAIETARNAFESPQANSEEIREVLTSMPSEQVERYVNLLLLQSAQTIFQQRHLYGNREIHQMVERMNSMIPEGKDVTFAFAAQTDSRLGGIEVRHGEEVTSLVHDWSNSPSYIHSNNVYGDFYYGTDQNGRQVIAILHNKRITDELNSIYSDRTKLEKALRSLEQRFGGSLPIPNADEVIEVGLDLKRDRLEQFFSTQDEQILRNENFPEEYRDLYATYLQVRRREQYQSTQEDVTAELSHRDRIQPEIEKPIGDLQKQTRFRESEPGEQFYQGDGYELSRVLDPNQPFTLSGQRSQRYQLNRRSLHLSSEVESLKSGTFDGLIAPNEDEGFAFTGQVANDTYETRYDGAWNRTQTEGIWSRRGEESLLSANVDIDGNRAQTYSHIERFLMKNRETSVTEEYRESEFRLNLEDANIRSTTKVGQGNQLLQGIVRGNAASDYSLITGFGLREENERFITSTGDQLYQSIEVGPEDQYVGAEFYGERNDDREAFRAGVSANRNEGTDEELSGVVQYFQIQDDQGRRGDKVQGQITSERYGVRAAVEENEVPLDPLEGNREHREVEVDQYVRTGIGSKITLSGAVREVETETATIDEYEGSTSYEHGETGRGVAVSGTYSESESEREDVQEVDGTLTLFNTNKSRYVRIGGGVTEGEERSETGEVGSIEGERGELAFRRNQLVTKVRSGRMSREIGNQEEQSSGVSVTFPVREMSIMTDAEITTLESDAGESARGEFQIGSRGRMGDGTFESYHRLTIVEGEQSQEDMIGTEHLAQYNVGDFRFASELLYRMEDLGLGEQRTREAHVDVQVPVGEEVRITSGVSLGDVTVEGEQSVSQGYRAGIQFPVATRRTMELSSGVSHSQVNDEIDFMASAQFSGLYGSVSAGYRTRYIEERRASETWDLRGRFRVAEGRTLPLRMELEGGVLSHIGATRSIEGEDLANGLMLNAGATFTIIGRRSAEDED